MTGRNAPGIVTAQDAFFSRWHSSHTIPGHSPAQRRSRGNIAVEILIAKGRNYLLSNLPVVDASFALQFGWHHTALPEQISGQ
jgi:hypothetical protein